MNLLTFINDVPCSSHWSPQWDRTTGENSICSILLYFRVVVSILFSSWTTIILQTYFLVCFSHNQISTQIIQTKLYFKIELWISYHVNESQNLGSCFLGLGMLKSRIQVSSFSLIPNTILMLLQTLLLAKCLKYMCYYVLSSCPKVWA